MTIQRVGEAFARIHEKRGGVKVQLNDVRAACRMLRSASRICGPVAALALCARPHGVARSIVLGHCAAVDSTETRRHAAEPLEPGQRVWVLDPATAGGKAWGTISTVSNGTGFFTGRDRFLVIVLDGGHVVLSCSDAHRGVRWDFAPLEVEAPP